MILFVAYALAVWFLAYQQRRRARALLVISGALLVLHTVNVAHGWVAARYDYTHLLPVFRVLMYPYMALVAAMGLFLAVMPRRLALVPCRLCEYELHELTAELGPDVACPECGTTPSQASTRAGRRLARRRLALAGRAEQIVALPEEHPAAHPGDQHQQR